MKIFNTLYKMAADWKFYSQKLQFFLIIKM